MSNSTIVISTEDESQYVRSKLKEYNAQHVPDEIRSRYERINLHIANEEGDIIAGLMSVLCWNWVEVEILWVDAQHRIHGYGSKLLQEIERIARAKQCSFLKLNTFSFQAPDFYRKHGFELIGLFDNAPTGHKHYYFKKDLT
ncbi:GNAT family N-acetyltransferase [Cohnella boryungensis]|uniref:GNAT family N-acetyltransferase n=1 Tax=Cohnella boryungensis TaxID=768479 RepID=A0ABV8SKB3_9BACL